jgi:hypothetical protein
MPTITRIPSFDLEEFKWTLESATNFYGALGTTATTAATSFPIFLLNEVTEGTAIGYSRTDCTPAVGSLTYFWDEALSAYKTNETSFTKTIPAGQTWDYQWALYLRNATAWANRSISSVDTTANTITFAANSATFATGDRVVITADTGGTLPGGLTQDPGSTRASVIMELLSPTGTTTITSQLRPLGGGSAIDLTSVGSGSLRVRSAAGQLYAVRIEDSQQAASGEITFKLTHFKRVFMVS